MVHRASERMLVTFLRRDSRDGKGIIPKSAVDFAGFIRGEHPAPIVALSLDSIAQIRVESPKLPSERLNRGRYRRALPRSGYRPRSLARGGPKATG